MPFMGGAATPAVAQSNGLARTPPMGWNDWYPYTCGVNAQLVEQTAQTMVGNGMKAAGYQYVNVDDCWMAPNRDAAGNLAPDPTRFPNGIKSVADYVHSLGLKFGIYEDAGVQTCAHFPGSYGHEARDAAAFASWGVDYLKYDQCSIPFADFPGETHEQVARTLYTRMSNALKATGRPIVFSMSNGSDPAFHPWSWGAAVANLWRTTPDVGDSFPAVLSGFQTTEALHRYAGPGAWNDPDMLQIGNGGATNLEYRTEFSLWAEMAAPLIAGTNLLALSPASLAIYENRSVIAVDQDPLGMQAVPVSSANGLWVLTKPLQGGDRSVLLFNSSDRPAMIGTTAAAAGLAKGRIYRLQDLWTGALSESGGKLSAFVRPHGVVMYRVSALPKRSLQTLPPNTVVSLAASPPPPDNGRPITVTESFTDNGVAPVSGLALWIQAPPGWTVRPLGGRHAKALAGGHALTARFRVSAPVAIRPITTVALTAAASYPGLGGRRTSFATIGELYSSPPAPPFALANTTGTLAISGESGQLFELEATGTGIAPAAAASGQPGPSDSYAAIYAPGAAGTASFAQVTITSSAAAGWGGATGLVQRNSMRPPAGSPAGVALYLSARGSVVMAWNASGGADVDRSFTVPAATVSTPVSLRLVRGGTEYTGYYSTDGGATWTQVASVAVAPAAAASRQDVGVFHASGVADDSTRADLANLVLR
jgi:alpha-galactosidase